MCRTPLWIPFAFAFLTAVWAQPAGAPAYKWSATGPLQVARAGACAAALPDGRILVAGGQGIAGALRSVELYQSDGTFLPARDMLGARMAHTCTTLSDGRVLVAGGLVDGPAVAAESYDPTTDTWTAAENGSQRWNHTATLLPDGRVLLAGGENSYGPSDLLEWFDPRTNRIRSLPGALLLPRTLHASAVLPDGSVLVAGGWNGERLLDGVEIVNLDGSVETTTPLPVPRAGHTATALDNGCVLIAGGLGGDGDLTSAALFCADSSSPNAPPSQEAAASRRRLQAQSYPGIFRSAGSMTVARYLHLAIVLPNNGKVLITGGFSQGEPTSASELYDPDANVFLPAGSLTLARLGIAAAADPTTGSVLAVGGYIGDVPLAACGILRGPSVVFDKTRYVDGDAVTVTGLGWTPGEKVTILVSTVSFTQPGQLGQISTTSFQPTASLLGRIQQTLFVAGTQTAGATYRAAATGVTSGLTAGSSARQVSRTTMSLLVSPFQALTRQLVLLQAVIQPLTRLDTLDGTVAFQAGTSPLGTVSSSQQFTTVSSTGQITDGTSNTIQIGETPHTGFGTNFSMADGSVRSVTAAGAFQLVTRDLPAGSNTLSASGGSVSAAYAPSTSLYAPSSGATTVSVQKRTVALATAQSLDAKTAPRVGDPITLQVSATPTQQPFADVAPTGKVHVTIASGIVVDSPPLSPQNLLTPTGSTSVTASQASVVITPPAGTRTLGIQYDGDAVFLAGSRPDGGTISVGKGSVGFTLISAKPTYTLGEPITLTARILHPRVVGATPTGQISRVTGPAQFQGAALSTDPLNTGVINTNLPVTGSPAPGNLTVTMTYGGDANFVSANAGVVLTITKAVPQITVIPPAQVVAGQEATFVVRASAPANLTSPPAVTGSVTLAGVANGKSASLVAGPTSSIGTIRQTFPTAGTFSISVQYGGDTNFQATASTAVQVVVQ